MTGKVFSEELCRYIMSCQERGKEIKQEMIKEMFLSKSTIKPFDPVKKLQLKVCKTAAKKNKVNMPDRVLQLSDEANFWRKIAIISSSRAFDLEIIGHYELSVVPYSLMDKRRNLHSGHQAQSKLITILKSSAGNNSTLTCPPVDCLVIDGFCMLRHVTRVS